MTNTAKPALPFGSRVADRYEISHLLGEGGVGQVYVASDLRLNRQVAVKVLLPRWAAHEAFRQRFLREARVASALRHPNAIQVYDYGEDQGHPYIVMELLSGNDLFEELTEHPQMPIDRVLELGHKIADVLTAAHLVQLVHRDLKPDNIFLDTSAGRERVVVLDFGMAFLAESEDSASGRLTMQGEIGGTPAYMAPEQASGEKVEPPADVYAMGCLLFEMLAGAPPFDGTIPVILSAHLYSQPPSLRLARPNLPSGLEELVMRMLDKRPSRRPTMEATRTRLAKLGAVGVDGRERARDASYLSTREVRMVDKPEVVADAATVMVPQRTTAVRLVAEAATDVVVGHLGPVESDISHGLAANGMRLVALQDGTPTPDVDAIFEPGLTATAAEVLVAHGLPVVTSCPVQDMDRIAALLRAGVAEVVPDPVNAALLAKRLWRVIRRNKVRRGTS